MVQEQGSRRKPLAEMSTEELYEYFLAQTKRGPETKKTPDTGQLVELKSMDKSLYPRVMTLMEIFGKDATLAEIQAWFLVAIDDSKEKAAQKSQTRQY